MTIQVPHWRKEFKKIQDTFNPIFYNQISFSLTEDCICKLLCVTAYVDFFSSCLYG